MSPTGPRSDAGRALEAVLDRPGRDPRRARLRRHARPRSWPTPSRPTPTRARSPRWPAGHAARHRRGHHRPARPDRGAPGRLPRGRGSAVAGRARPVRGGALGRDDRRVRHPARPRPGRRAASRRSRRCSTGSARATRAIEHKGRAVVVHTRAAARPGRLVRDAGGAADRPGASGTTMVVEPGKNVLEIRSPGIDKGEALRDIVAETGARRSSSSATTSATCRRSGSSSELRREGRGGLLVCSASHEEDALVRAGRRRRRGPGGVADLARGARRQPGRSLSGRRQSSRTARASISMSISSSGSPTNTVVRAGSTSHRSARKSP